MFQYHPVQSLRVRIWVKLKPVFTGNLLDPLDINGIVDVIELIKMLLFYYQYPGM
jgi:hypothetical protein